MHFSALLQSTLLALAGSVALVEAGVIGQAGPMTPWCSPCSDGCGTTKDTKFLDAHKTTTRLGWSTTYGDAKDPIQISTSDAGLAILLDNQGAKDGVVRILYTNYKEHTSQMYLSPKHAECLIPSPPKDFTQSEVSGVSIYVA